ncbi:hypothetical protein Kpol_2000p82 [Vanderwaltozyma polyspora DSM 70294]|uniref:DNA damage checkpoint protein LCD1 n=1 Tax=Vanderwaltozyma polyspora (strain ATCC 22028 / DSM 70294 / BCRC 21397 / CBS 2163 / NBRC 10782 / NRRL Y-8283 / UCD 57-17) TaxID=436907 RepID=A7TF89_VANPO|nr:uncharacterized protein Kpol_2000p82 [Vanderwaltozyma polyspora DSM 70294]EDO19114.1 hypothetical protein Kpol_2000p82 [Vanderwaltozyma polyspora DSM 70294]
MSMNDDSFLDDDDDDDILLELGSRPPKIATQFFSTAPTQFLPDTKPSSQEQQQQTAPSDNDNVDSDLKMELTKAQGEASMLRDKINLLNQERELEKQAQKSNKETTESSHKHKLEQLQKEIQYLQDENKFLNLESKRLSNYNRSKQRISRSGTPDTANTSNVTDTITTTTTSATNISTATISTAYTSPLVKKRKIEESTPVPRKNYISINPTRVTPDETSEFFDTLMLHKICGVELTTIEILRRIKLGHIDTFHHGSLIIKTDDSIGDAIIDLLLKHKKSAKLNNFIDTLLEHVGSLIIQISMDKKESNLAVPFLIVLMQQSMIFRPSAVPYVALKDIFIFACDLIKKFQHVLKESLHESPFELYVEPQIFQYELIDTLIVFYSFDMLETSLRILQSHQVDAIKGFFDESTMKSIEYIYKTTLALSFKTKTNVIFNTVEILNILSTMALMVSSNGNLIEYKWWSDCIIRLFNVLNKEIDNRKLYEEDNTNLYLSRFDDFYGLIRNIGNNSIGRVIVKLIDGDKLQSIPKVISKDDLTFDTEDNFMNNNELEKWFLELKETILNIIDNLMIIYSNERDIINHELLKQMVQMLTKEQKFMIEKKIGQLSMNLGLRCEIIEHLISIVYNILMNHNDKLGKENVKDIESELILALWRIVASYVKKPNEDDIMDNVQLIDKLYEMRISDEIEVFDESMEDMPEYMLQELKHDLVDRAPRIMQLQYNKIYQEMAREILEALDISLEEMDSLYVAMGV